MNFYRQKWACSFNEAGHGLWTGEAMSATRALVHKRSRSIFRSTGVHSTTMPLCNGLLEVRHSRVGNGE